VMIFVLWYECAFVIGTSVDAYIWMRLWMCDGLAEYFAKTD
jgi:hypothetical protein